MRPLTLVKYFVDRGLFISWSCYYVLVVRWNVTAQHRWGFFRLQYYDKTKWLKTVKSPSLIQPLTLKIFAPYGVRQAFNKLSFPVDTNHLPQVAKRSERTQLSCKCNWYLSGLVACNTSTCEFSIPTASHSPKRNNRLAISPQRNPYI